MKPTAKQILKLFNQERLQPRHLFYRSKWRARTTKSGVLLTLVPTWMKRRPFILITDLDGENVTTIDTKLTTQTRTAKRLARDFIYKY